MTYRPRMYGPAAALAAVLWLGGSACAQTYTADDGNPAVTEPGGTMGRDGADNVRQGIRDGEAVGVPRGTVVEERLDADGRLIVRPAGPPR